MAANHISVKAVPINKGVRPVANKEDDDDDGMDGLDPMLQEVCDDKLSTQSAAGALATRVTTAADLAGELSDVWSCILGAAQAEPTMQPKLVSIMTHLASLPDVYDKDDKLVEIYGMVLWRDMPTWGWELNDEWNHLKVPSDPGPGRTDAIAAWIAQNHFSALLFQTKVPSLQAPLLALWTFRAACESDHTPADMDVHVPAATVWIDVAGKLIMDCDEQFPPAGGARPGVGGVHWSGQHGYCRGRWDLWRTRFEAIADDGAISAATASLARRAAQAMAELDGSQI